MNNVNAVLLLSCADSKGLVARISDFIFRFDGNIVHADQYTAKAEKLFFMRVEWELNGFALDRDDIPVAFAPLAKQYQMKWDLHFTDYVPRAAIFVSRHLHCLHDLILRRDMGELAADIKAVISNHEDARDLAEQYGMQYFYFPVTGKNKKQQEKKELRLLRDLHIDLVVLARYMQILSGNFLKYYPSRIINIHHSFLPAFAGRNPYQQAYDRGVKIIGATGHYVTAQLDEGRLLRRMS